MRAAGASTLGRWGAAFLGEPRAKDASRAGWYVLSMLATFRPELAAQLDETFELRVDDDVFEILVASGKVAAEQVPAARSPDSTLALDVEGLIGLLAARCPCQRRSRRSGSASRGEPARSSVS